MEWKEVSAGREPAAGKSAKTGKGAGRPASRPARGAPKGKAPQEKRSKPPRPPAQPAARSPVPADKRFSTPPRSQGGARERALGDAGVRNYSRQDGQRLDNPSGSRPARKKPVKRRLRPGFFIGLALVAVMVLVVLSLTVFFPVTDIQVTGETRYEASRILEVSALKAGDNLLLADTDTAADRILKQLPYIGTVHISRRLPGTLVIETAEADPVCVLEREGTYLLLNEKNKVVDESDQKPSGLLLIRGMETGDYEKGTDIAFSNKDQEELLRSLLDRLRNQGLPVTLVDLSDSVQIYFVIDNRILVKFGAASDLDKKLSHMLAVCEQMEEGATGTLDMSWWSANKKDAYFKQGALEEAWLVPTAQPEGAEGEEAGQASGDTPAGPDDVAAPSASDPGSPNPPASPE